MTTAPSQKIPVRAWGIVVLVSLALLLFILDRQDLNNGSLMHELLENF